MPRASTNPVHASTTWVDLLRQLLQDRSQAEVARLLGVSQQTISTWLRGARVPYRTRAPIIAERLQVSEERILELIQAQEQVARGD